MAQLKTSLEHVVGKGGQQRGCVLAGRPGITKHQLFGELNEEFNLISREVCSMRAQTLLAIVPPTPLPYKLKSGENIYVYNP